jgi:pimeloyl-ACP methyl ester carboxylesterase
MRKIELADKERLHTASAKKCLYNQDNPTLFEKTKNVFLIRKDVYKTTSLSSLRSNYLSTLRKIDVPTLVIGSKEDKVVPYICSLQTHFLITGSEFHGFEKTGHLSNIEQKEEFNFLVRNFILKQRRRSA